MRTRYPLLLLLLITASATRPAAAAPTTAHWVGSWGASPLSEPNHSGAFASDTTLREIVHLSAGGSALRIVLSNEFGTADLKIGGASVALPSSSTTSDDGAIQLKSSSPVLFGGQPTITIAPGAMVVSDPVAMHVAPLSNLAVTLFVPAQTVGTLSYHALGLQTNYAADGNQLQSEALTHPRVEKSWDFLKGVDVRGSAEASIVCFGDSITDGYQSTPDANDRWPDVLAARLQGHGNDSRLAVLNEGISGNRVLHDGYGPSAVSRLDRDVLAQAGVRYLIVLESINDIGRLNDPHRPGDLIAAEDLIQGLEQIITRAHLKGIMVYGATLTPYEGAKYDSPAGEAVRHKVNDFIRHGGKFDGVIDFAKVTADPDHPGRFLAADDSGDHLHPNDAGYKAMGNAIDLSLFSK